MLGRGGGYRGILGGRDGFSSGGVLSSLHAVADIVNYSRPRYIVRSFMHIFSQGIACSVFETPCDVSRRPLLPQFVPFFRFSVVWDSQHSRHFFLVKTKPSLFSDLLVVILTEHDSYSESKALSEKKSIRAVHLQSLCTENSCIQRYRISPF